MDQSIMLIKPDIYNKCGSNRKNKNQKKLIQFIKVSK